MVHTFWTRMSRFVSKLFKDISKCRSKQIRTFLLFMFFLIVYLTLFKCKHIVITKDNHITDHTEDYVGLLCGTEKRILHSKKGIKDVKPELDNKTHSEESHLISVASQINTDNNKVLFTVINQAYLPFAYSWLCNTKPMDIHRSVLIVTTDKQSKEKLKSDWPEINVISMDLGIMRGNQSYGKVGYIKIIVKRTKLIQSLLMANIGVFVFEVDCLWLANPLPGISTDQLDDIIVNTVSLSNGRLFAGGFVWIRSTCRAKIIWQKVTDLMVALGKKIENLTETDILKAYEEKSDQYYFAKLVQDGYANVSLKILPLELYADGKWYELSEKERSKIHPVVINNNWIVGNDAKIERAKQWNHWFIRKDLTCDMDLVYKTIY